MNKLRISGTSVVLEKDGKVVLVKQTSEEIKELLELAKKVVGVKRCIDGLRKVSTDHFSCEEFYVRVAEKLEYYIERGYLINLLGHIGKDDVNNVIWDAILNIMTQREDEDEKASM